MAYKPISSRGICRVGENKNTGDRFANPADHLGPYDSWIVDNLDWSWAFAVYGEVSEYPEYQVGTNGSVWTCRSAHAGFYTRWRRLKGESLGGYRRVRLESESGSRRVFIHELILETFVGSCPEGMLTRHFPDRDRTNNNLWNLHWGTFQENSDDRKTHGTDNQGSRSPNAKLSESDVEEILRLATSGMTQTDISARFGVDQSRLSHIFAGRAWTHVKGDRPKVGRYAQKFHPDAIAEMFRLREQGWPRTRIAERFSTGRGVVTQILNADRNSNPRTIS